MDIIAVICFILIILLVLTGGKIAVLLGAIAKFAPVITIILLIIGIIMELDIIILSEKSIINRILSTVAHLFLTACIVGGSYLFWTTLIVVDTSGSIGGMIDNFFAGVAAVIDLFVYFIIMYVAYFIDVAIMRA